MDYPDNTEQMTPVQYEPKRTGRASHRRRKAAKHLTPGLVFVQILTGVIVILGFLCCAQFTWQMGAMSLNFSSVTHELERGATTKAETTVKDSVANPQQGDPPSVQRVSDGELFAYMRIPRFGVDYKLPIQEGTEKAVLDNMGAGHYESTAMPGEVGNTSYAGHRYPGDFGYLDQMQTGDEIIIETADYWYVYTVSQAPFIVPETQTDVILPSAVDSERGLTLTTCDPMFAVGEAADRLIVHASFSYWALKSDGVPSSLAEEHVTSTEKLKRVVDKVSEQVDMPVCGTLSVGLLVIWLILDLLAWMVSHSRMVGLWKSSPTANPVMLVWRLQAGVVPVRVVLMLVLCAGLLFACWEWMCPWVADVVPLFSTPHPTV